MREKTISLSLNAVHLFLWLFYEAAKIFAYVHRNIAHTYSHTHTSRAHIHAFRNCFLAITTRSLCFVPRTKVCGVWCGDAREHWERLCGSMARVRSVRLLNRYTLYAKANMECNNVLSSVFSKNKSQAMVYHHLPTSLSSSSSLSHFARKTNSKEKRKSLMYPWIL